MKHFFVLTTLLLAPLSALPAGRVVIPKESASWRQNEFKFF
jgi:hypothetical protein